MRGGPGNFAMQTGDEFETELIREAAAGDMAALTTLLVECRPRLCEQLKRRVPRPLSRVLDVDDVVQQAHLEAFRHIDTLAPAGADAFYRWVAVIALRKLRDAVRRQRAAKRGGTGVALSGAHAAEESMVALLDLIEDPKRSPSRSAAGHEATRAVQNALKCLPADYARAVRLVYLQGCTVEEAAREMGRTDRAIHNLCYKARDRLRELLGNRSRFLSDDG